MPFYPSSLGCVKESRTAVENPSFHDGSSNFHQHLDLVATVPKSEMDAAFWGGPS